MAPTNSGVGRPIPTLVASSSPPPRSRRSRCRVTHNRLASARQPAATRCPAAVEYLAFIRQRRTSTEATADEPAPMRALEALLGLESWNAGPQPNHTAAPTGSTGLHIDDVHGACDLHVLSSEDVAQLPHARCCTSHQAVTESMWQLRGVSGRLCRGGTNCDHQMCPLSLVAGR